MKTTTMEEQIKDILSEILNGDEAKFSELHGIEAAHIAQEAERIMVLHREILGRFKRKIEDICAEFGDQPALCLSILGEHLNGGGKEVVF